MSKQNIGLLFGGKSGEHQVSITSARAIAKGLSSEENQDKYYITPIYIDKNGYWWGKEIAQAVLDSGIPKEDNPQQELSLWKFPPECETVEVWLPVLHGPNGEDGTVQGLLTLMQVPFVGSGVLGSSLGMDKIAMKNAFAQAGLAQVDYVEVNSSDVFSNPCVFTKLCDEIDTKLGYPCFIKPANLGSSVGISKAKTRADLEKALDEAAHLDRRIIVEASAVGREVECAVLGNDQAQASVVGEITFDADFYDYETKYTDGKANLIIPADLPQEVSEKIREMSLVAFKEVSARGLSRVDFFYIPETREILINEINTFPGFTSLSMYPQLWKASGVEFAELLDKLIALAQA